MIKVKETASSSESKSYSEHINEKMIKAAESGDHEDVSRALEEGAEITCRDSSGDTGLHIGAWKGHDNVVMTFLEADIDVNIRDGANTKWTALINAAYFDKISCLQILLENGAEPDLKSEKDGQTALMYSSIEDYPDILAELLVKNADMNILNNDGENAIQLAQEYNSQDAAKLLEAWGDQEALNQKMMTAARQGRGRLVSGLLRAGADLQATDEEGNTVISLLNTGMLIAATEGSSGNISGFIRAGADVQTKL